MEKIDLEGEKIRIINTPGHSYDSVCFHFGNTLISGDTLFIGIIGKCFTGNMKLYFSSIKLLSDLPMDTIVYPGHDYVRYALKKAKKLEPYNDDIDYFLVGQYDPNHVRSTLEWGKKINPCLRFKNKKLRATLNEMGLKADSDFDCFRSVREYL